MSTAASRTSSLVIRCLTVAAITAAVLSVATAMVAPQKFFVAYLAAILLPWSISIGSLTLMLVFALTGGRWARASWPWLAINTQLMPLVALLFVPWLLGIHQIYPWANSDILHRFEHTANRQWYYQMSFFTGRTVSYFVIWCGLAWMATWPFSRQTKDASPESHLRILGGQPAAGMGLIIVLLTVTWASIDWIMSFDPFFKSTMFGSLIGMGSMMATISGVVAATCFWPHLRHASCDDKTARDLTNLMLTFLMLWAYFSFAHFLIMWSGNLPLEARFYQLRTRGIWAWLSPALAVSGFILPFFYLLSHDLKRSRRKVGTLAIFLIGVRQAELWWMVLPASGDERHGWLYWSIIPTSVAVIAIYVLALIRGMRRCDLSTCRELSHE